ncbi:PEP-CTERM sorting domain-containing protein [Hydrogenophaga intermedia]|uniref:PEP-CTERM sorting domain-containing protein n=1 Tax=Hydrogenophaga intermedia TaxID=65786 RepID=UPI002043E6B5|nr:PEP-CTERM sorting domain-containing protein [Hydrogenophaga intermedia]MCM3565188.1 PEP-CTERM sorting domain-containing protein [Hydrogenophaga intermedia]
MKRKIVKALAAAGLALCAATTAQAAYVGTTPASNDVIGIAEGWFGANLYLIAGAATTITVEFIGKEAGYTNRFYLEGAERFNTGALPGSTVDVLVDPGLIDFAFFSNMGSGNPLAASVTNGSNQDPVTNLLNYFITFDDNVVNGSTPSSGQTVLIALDDTGAGPDDNHDDMVIRLTISNGGFQVPEPGTLALLGLGALAAGLARRRQIKA